MWIWLCEDKLKVKVAHFRLPSASQKRACLSSLIGSLSNDDVKENGNNAIGLDWKNNNFARASRFFVHFFAVVARLQRESA